MTRALVVHPGFDFSVADVHRNLVTGLRANGVTVADFNLNDRLVFYTGAHHERDGEFVKALEQEDAYRLAAKGLHAAAYELWPDLVVIVSAYFVPPETYALLRSRRHRLVLWCTESPYEDDRQIRPAALCDRVVVNDPTNLDRFGELAPTRYLPHMYDPSTHCPGPAVDGLRSDVCFVGTGFPSRVELLEKVDWDGIDLALAGSWKAADEASPLRRHLRAETVANSEAVDWYRSTRASFNLYRREAERPELSAGWAMGPREVELAACGTFFARDPRPEGDEVLSMLPTFTTPAELGELLRWWLAHDEERAAAAAAARAAVHDRTNKAVTAELLRWAA